MPCSPRHVKSMATQFLRDMRLHTFHTQPIEMERYFQILTTSSQRDGPMSEPLLHVARTATITPYTVV